MIGKFKEILFFLFIFSLVSQALSMLAISSTDVGTGELVSGAGLASEATASLLWFIASLGVAFAGGLAISTKVGIVGSTVQNAFPPEKFVVNTLFTTVIIFTLLSTIKLIWNLAASVPLEAGPAMGIFVYIFFGVLGLIIVWSYMEMMSPVGGDDE